MPQHRIPARRPPFRRSIARFFLLVVLVVAIGLIVVQARDFGTNKISPPNIKGPSHSEVNRAIRLSQVYLDGLYKPLSYGGAVQSEAYGLPFVAHIPSIGSGTASWIMTGWGDTGTCLPGCYKATSIKSLNDDSTVISQEAYEITFDNPDTDGVLKIKVHVDWGYNDAQQFKITIDSLTVSAYSELYLDKKLVASYKRGDRKRVEVVYNNDQVETLRSLRYTIRHATQEAYMYWVLRGGEQLAANLAKFMSDNGYRPGFDLRAPMFNMGRDLPDDFPFNKAVYGDCDHLPQRSNEAYPYDSKACLVLDAYFEAAKRDSHLPTILALHTLLKYGDMDHKFPDKVTAFMPYSTPREVASYLERTWATLGYGIHKCGPTNCYDYASAIRTFAFGSLMLELHRYGYENAMAYADAVAAMAVASQVRDGGLLQQATGETYYRPALVGAFPGGWQENGYYVPTPVDAVVKAGLEATRQQPMPTEYEGVQPTNSETTFDGWAFLKRYRCARFGLGCSVYERGDYDKPARATTANNP